MNLLEWIIRLILFVPYICLVILINRIYKLRKEGRKRVTVPQFINRKEKIKFVTDKTGKLAFSFVIILEAIFGAYLIVNHLYQFSVLIGPAIVQPQSELNYFSKKYNIEVTERNVYQSTSGRYYCDRTFKEGIRLEKCGLFEFLRNALFSDWGLAIWFVIVQGFTIGALVLTLSIGWLILFIYYNSSKFNLSRPDPG